MDSPSPLASFKARNLCLRRGAREIWNNAAWDIAGPTAILGPNGSGKSSTLSLIAGQLSPDSGTVDFLCQGNRITEEHWMTQVSIAAPWVELPAHLTLEEAIAFHAAFRTSRPGELSWNAFVDSSGLNVGLDVPLRLWSSGQRQRLSLALALGSEGKAVLLDEPASNLDHDGVAWMRRGLDAIGAHTTVVVATNDEKKEAPKGASLLRI